MSPKPGTDNRMLLQPYILGDLKLSKRVVMAPLTRMRAVHPSGILNELMRDYYVQRASAGLIVTEGTFVSDQARGWFGAPGIYTEAKRKGCQKITDEVHRSGGRIAVQLWHQGSVSNRDLVGNGRSPICTFRYQPRAAVYTGFGTTEMTAVPEAMSQEDILQTVGDRLLLKQPLGQILWLFHVDSIHHRGQISTYLRRFGAKVPSIYGPSGDSQV